MNYCDSFQEPYKCSDSIDRINYAFCDKPSLRRSVLGDYKPIIQIKLENWEEKLIENKLQIFIQIFKSQGYDDIDLWENMSKNELVNLGITNGHLKKWERMLSENKR